jgi:hypothetical protein
MYDITPKHMIYKHTTNSPQKQESRDDHLLQIKSYNRRRISHRIISHNLITQPHMIPHNSTVATISKHPTTNTPQELEAGDDHLHHAVDPGRAELGEDANAQTHAAHRELVRVEDVLEGLLRGGSVKSVLGHL